MAATQRLAGGTGKGHKSLRNSRRGDQTLTISTQQGLVDWGRPTRVSEDDEGKIRRATFRGEGRIYSGAGLACGAAPFGGLGFPKRLHHQQNNWHSVLCAFQCQGRMNSPNGGALPAAFRWKCHRYVQLVHPNRILPFLYRRRRL